MVTMQKEPATKRAFAFIDGGNTREAARKAFGESFSSFNPVALAEELCRAQGWVLVGVSYYLGVPDVRVAEESHTDWMTRCTRWRKQGIRIFTRTLVEDEQGLAREKGIDVRLALDAVGLFHQGAYDVAVVVSQNQDFSELAAELKQIAADEKRWIDVASAFPWSPRVPAHRGIGGTNPVRLDEDAFRHVLDTPDNRRRIVMQRVASKPTVLDEAEAPVTRAIAAGVASRWPASSATASQPRERARSPIRRAWSWVAGLATAYLLVAGGTFGYLAWESRSALTTTELRTAELVGNAHLALAWPRYWMGKSGA